MIISVRLGVAMKKCWGNMVIAYKRSIDRPAAA